MASAISERAMCRQSIANISEFIVNREHLGFTTPVLKQRLEYLERNWRKFRATHRKVLRVLEPEEAEEEAILFTKTEKEYLSTTAHRCVKRQ